MVIGFYAQGVADVSPKLQASAPTAVTVKDPGATIEKTFRGLLFKSYGYDTEEAPYSLRA